MDNLYLTMYDYISNLKIIDTHEHLPSYPHLNNVNSDIINEVLSIYLEDDLMAAGIPMDDWRFIKNSKNDFHERWTRLQPFWEFCYNTGYFRMIRKALKGIYGVEDLNAENLDQVNAQFLELQKRDRYEDILKNACNIEYVVLDVIDCNMDVDRRYFKPVIRANALILPCSAQDVENLEMLAGFSICSFSDWLDACTIYLEDAYSKGAVGIKNSLAYMRGISYKRETFYDAEKSFNETFFKFRTVPRWENRTISLGEAAQNYIMHHILQFAEKKKLVYQIHTGELAGGPNYINMSDPALMTNLFIEYPNVTFDIMHIGYPYFRTLAAIAKMFPNVYIDMCWAHMLSPKSSIESLSEYLDSVPHNKILAFGGDSHIIDGSYGHLMLARENVATVLAEKVACGAYTLEKAKEIAENIFYNNPKRIFG